MEKQGQAVGTAWMCGRCNLTLENRKTQVSYLGNVFVIDLPTCPGCGLVVVTEEAATGKMAEAEQVLEDK